MCAGLTNLSVCLSVSVYQTIINSWVNQAILGVVFPLRIIALMAFLCSIDGKKHPVACKSFPFIKDFENDGRMFIPNETQSKISVSENSTRAECNALLG